MIGIVGLTGGIASGKTTVATLFQNLGVPILDADVISRELVVPQMPAWKKIVECFGKKVLNPDQTLNRNALKKIVFANKIYQEIIPRVMNYMLQMNIYMEDETLWYLHKNGNLNMNILLKEFQNFYRENSESWLERFTFKEAGHQLLLMAYLQRVINGGGQIEREMALGNGRCDMVVIFNNQNFVMELKIKGSNFNFEKNKIQLIQYLDKINEPHGYLIIFESKPSTEIAWENRVKWYDIEHTWNEITKQITVVEM